MNEDLGKCSTSDAGSLVANNADTEQVTLIKAVEVEGPGSLKKR